MKTIEVNKLELINGGGFWSSLGDAVAGACTVYNGSIILGVISNLNPALKAARLGCYGYLAYRGINAL